jgi:hypothetical protein
VDTVHETGAEKALLCEGDVHGSMKSDYALMLSYVLRRNSVLSSSF